jgi:hypothetical protein
LSSFSTLIEAERLRLLVDGFEATRVRVIRLAAGFALTFFALRRPVLFAGLVVDFVFFFFFCGMA